MNVVNVTPLEAAITLYTDKHGYEYVVAVAKGAFTIEPDGTCVLAEEQQPLVYADEFTGEPGYSAARYESDFAPFKPRCDVLLNGSAYAPGGRPATQVSVALQIGSINKSFRVVGDRHWQMGVLGPGTSRPEPFTLKPISYDKAFGGFDDTHENPQKHRTFLENPVGVGFHNNMDPEHVVGKPLPNTEELNRPVKKPDGAYRPMAFGAIGRNFKARVDLAGTYDQTWVDEQFPFLPLDFDDRYFQAAPEDQQGEHLRGGEVVRLINLSPEGRLEFRVPTHAVPVKLIYQRHQEHVESVCDTLIVEPDGRRCMLTWRASTRIKGKVHHLREVQFGAPSKARQRAMDTGKRYVNWKEVTP